MKQIQSTTKGLLVIILSCMQLNTACSNKKITHAEVKDQSVGTLVILGFDHSLSMSGYRHPDTGFVGGVCRSISHTGGLVVLYGIGDPNDLSGIRCYLTPVPEMDKSLVISKQAELRHRINKLIAENELKIRQFLHQVQEQVFYPIHDTVHKIMNTDLVGFFRKIEILLNEPDHHTMKRYVFCYSDGIQSIRNHDSPATFDFHTSAPFTLCLAGWKAKSPCENTETEKFEDSNGFLQYLNNKTIHIN